MNHLLKILIFASLVVPVGCGSDSSTNGGAGGGVAADASPDTTSGGSGGVGGTDASPDSGEDTSTGGMSGSSGAGGSSGAAGSSGVGGSAGSGGIQDAAPDPICTPDEARCQGLDVETCNSDGTSWDITQTCPFLCEDGACKGSCLPGSSQCDGFDVQSCNTQGDWTTVVTCPFVCHQGACTGVCVPDTKKCEGLTPQVCGPLGQWKDQAPCPVLCTAGDCVSGCTPGEKLCNGLELQTCTAGHVWEVTQTCPYVCSAGACTGVCTPGTTQCSGSTIQVCSSQGQWTSGSTCPAACLNGVCVACTPGSTRCSGNTVETCNSQGSWATGQTCPVQCLSGSCVSCTPGDKQCDGLIPQTCNSSGSWVDGQPCTHLCSAGLCSGTCTPGTTQCNGTELLVCSAAGSWTHGADCQYACVAGACAGVCVPGTKRCSGTSIETCSVEGQWEVTSTCPFVCSSATCTGECIPGTKKCEGTAVATCGLDGYWGTSVACPTAAVNLHQDPSCSGGVCGYVCKAGYDNCDGVSTNGCEASLLTDAHHCGFCARDCLEGSCGAGVCNPISISVGGAAASSVAVDDTNIYWTDSVGGKVQFKSKTSGEILTLASSQPSARWIVRVQDKLYWSTLTNISGTYYGNIASVSVSGGPATQVVSLQQGFGGTVDAIAADSQYVYWPNATNGINKTTIAGTETTLVGTPRVGLFDMVSSGMTVWWTLGGNAGDTVMKAAVAGGAAQVEANGQAMPLGIAYYGGNLYWANQGVLAQNNTGSIMQLNTTTSQPTILAQTQFRPRWITADASRVFWSDFPDIRQIPANGGSITVLTGRSGAAAQTDARMANDSLYVYWVYANNLYKVAKHLL